MTRNTNPKKKKDSRPDIVSQSHSVVDIVIETMNKIVMHHDNRSDADSDSGTIIYSSDETKVCEK